MQMTLKWMNIFAVDAQKHIIGDTEQYAMKAS